MIHTAGYIRMLEAYFDESWTEPRKSVRSWKTMFAGIWPRRITTSKTERPRGSQAAPEFKAGFTHAGALAASRSVLGVQTCSGLAPVLEG
jgi:hypothetical protein